MTYILQVVKGFGLNQEVVISTGLRNSRLAIQGNSDRTFINLVGTTEGSKGSLICRKTGGEVVAKTNQEQVPAQLGVGHRIKAGATAIGDRVVGAILADHGRHMSAKGCSNKLVAVVRVVPELIQKEPGVGKSTSKNGVEGRQGVLKGGTQSEGKQHRGGGHRGIVFNRDAAMRQSFHSGAAVLGQVKGFNIPDSIS